MRWIILISLVLPAFAGNLELARQEAGRLFAEWKIGEAERVMRQAVDAERRAGAADPLFPIVLNELGTLNQDLGRHREAEHFYKESIALGDKSSFRWSTGFPLTNLAGLMLAFGRPRDALDFATRGAQNHARIFGNESPEVAMSNNTRAHAFAQLGRLTESESAAEVAIAILQKHPSGENLGVSYYILGEIAWFRSDVAKAEEFLTKANAIWAEALPYGHPTAITGIASLGALKARSAPQESNRLLQQALDLAETKLGKQHYFTANILLLYAEKLEVEGRKREAKALKQRGEAILTAYSRENLLLHTIDMNAFRTKTLKTLK